MLVVTSGHPYLDIDAYGGCTAYAELVQTQGKAAIAASSATWNESITRTIRGWQTGLVTDYHAGPEDTFILIDVSDPAQFDPLAAPERIVGIIDHHPGKELFWEERLGTAARIERIGAASTQVYEAWQAAGLSGHISATSARLLATGILDNTLNFSALVTTPRDHAAYQALMHKAGLPDSWPAQYFRECHQAILADITTALANDTKLLTFTHFPGQIAVGQLVVWNAGKILTGHLQALTEAMQAKQCAGWFVNMVSIEEGRSYFVCDDPAVQHWLHTMLGITFDHRIAPASRLWLRKEILRHALETAAPEAARAT